MKTLDTYEERKAFVEELKQQWRTLWRERIDDEVRAEGISSKDYSELFVERGTVIIATRKFKPPDFFDIVQQHLLTGQGDINSVLPSPRIGGWGKFVRNVLGKQQSSVKRRRGGLIETDKKVGQQLKKNGRGWLHFRRERV